MINRPRRNRLTSGVRGLIRETNIRPRDLVWPTFVQEGNNLRTPIGSMPGVSRLSIDQLVIDSHKAFELGIPAVALFPAIDDSLKNSEGKESLNTKGLLQRAVKKLKKGEMGPPNPDGSQNETFIATSIKKGGDIINIITGHDAALPTAKAVGGPGGGP